jgi:hypothetical protein
LKYQDQIITINESLFNAKQAQLFQSIDFEEQQRQLQKEAENKAYLNRIRIYGLLAGLGVFLIIAIILWRNNYHRQKAYALLKEQKQETDIQREKAEQTGRSEILAQLIQSEKWPHSASHAGIAHEVGI